MNGGEPNAGRRLLSWAQQAGLSNVTVTTSTWCLATPDSRSWWGNMWADRILNSKIADQLCHEGIASQSDLERVSQAWQNWVASEDGWMSIVHGEIVCHVS